MALNSSNFSNYGSTSTDTEIIIPANNSRELTSICDNISTNIYTINGCIKNLKGVIGQVGTQRDNQGLRDQIHVWQLSANQVVKATPKDIARLTVLGRTANKQQKLQIEKITSHFKEAVQAYGQIQQVTADKLRSNLLKSQDLMNQSTQDTDFLLQDEQIQAQKNLEFEQEMLIEREHRITQIESDILDVNQLMRELGALVHEQGSVVDSIENNVESVNQNVELGRQELASAANYQTKLRKKKLYLLILLIVVLIVLIGIIAWSAS